MLFGRGILAHHKTRRPQPRQIKKRFLRSGDRAAFDDHAEKCADQRHLERLLLRNPRILYTRACTRCSASVQTTYAPERAEKVYCEKCYLEEVY